MVLYLQRANSTPFVCLFLVRIHDYVFVVSGVYATSRFFTLGVYVFACLSCTRWFALRVCVCVCVCVEDCVASHG